MPEPPQRQHDQVKDRLAVLMEVINMTSKGWRIFQIVQLVLFICFSVFLFARTVDGHGTVQTLEIRLISFAVWGIFYLGVLVIEWLVYIVRHTKK
ncbi:DUF3923 family protein [Thermophilibacter sp.]